MKKEKPLTKGIKLEILLDNTQRLENENKLTTDPDLQAEIIQEANITRGHKRDSLLTPEVKVLLKNLRKTTP